MATIAGVEPGQTQQPESIQVYHVGGMDLNTCAITADCKGASEQKAGIGAEPGLKSIQDADIPSGVLTTMPNAHPNLMLLHKTKTTVKFHCEIKT